MIKPAETKRIYEGACRTKRITPQDEEGRAWHRVLRDFEVRDVEAALDAWWGNTTPGHNGEPRGKWMPTPAELKPLVQLISANRLAQSRKPKDYVLWTCPKGHRYGSFVVRGQELPATKPCGCGAELRPQRDAALAGGAYQLFQQTGAGTCAPQQMAVMDSKPTEDIHSENLSLPAAT